MDVIPAFPGPTAALRTHWPLYLAEAAELGAFMLAACLATALLFHTGSTLNPWLARMLMGLAMGLTVVGIIKSKPGQASGAHFNPAVTIAFYRLGKIGPYDTLFYILFQFAGGIGGVALAALIATPPRLADPHVLYAVTVPRPGGTLAAFIAELAISTLTMATVLYTSSKPKLAPYTTYFIGFLIFNYVLFESPISGFSQNPARTVASAVFPQIYTALWVYFVAPLLGMLTAAELFLRLTAPHPARHSYLRHRHLTQRNELL